MQRRKPLTLNLNRKSSECEEVRMRICPGSLRPAAALLRGRGHRGIEVHLKVTLQSCTHCFTSGASSALSCLTFNLEMKDQPETGSGVGLRSVFPSHSGTRVELQEVGVVLQQRQIENGDTAACRGKASDSVGCQGKVEQ